MYQSYLLSDSIYFQTKCKNTKYFKYFNAKYKFLTVLLPLPFYPFPLYSLGDIPVTRLKYFPKNDCEGKFSASLICSMVMLVDFRSAFASKATWSSIRSLAGLPPVALMTFDRCLGVTHSFSA